MGLFKIALQFRKIFCRVPFLGRVEVTAAEQRVANNAAHRGAVHMECDHNIDQTMISVFGNTEILFVSS